jgi:hypothetical protein
MAMSPEEVTRVVRENIGKKIRATPLQSGDHPVTTPSILSIASVDEEGFVCYDFSDPALIDPTVPNYAQFWDFSEVELVEDSK